MTLGDTHAICEECWPIYFSPSAFPGTLWAATPDFCCWCSRYTRALLYTIQDPAGVRCVGSHLKTVEVDIPDVLTPQKVLKLESDL